MVLHRRTSGILASRFSAAPSADLPSPKTLHISLSIAVCARASPRKLQINRLLVARRTVFGEIRMVDRGDSTSLSSSLSSLFVIIIAILSNYVCGRVKKDVINL